MSGPILPTPLGPLHLWEPGTMDRFRTHRNRRYQRSSIHHRPRTRLDLACRWDFP